MPVVRIPERDFACRDLGGFGLWGVLHELLVCRRELRGAHRHIAQGAPRTTGLRLCRAGGRRANRQRNRHHL